MQREPAPKLSDLAGISMKSRFEAFRDDVPFPGFSIRTRERRNIHHVVSPFRSLHDRHWIRPRELIIGKIANIDIIFAVRIRVPELDGVFDTGLANRRPHDAMSGFLRPGIDPDPRSGGTQAADGFSQAPIRILKPAMAPSTCKGLTASAEAA
ncbi:MAG: hypothetical protein NT080_09125 [Spirochaetes bacterium]|nr:hypothetical protein [Spirochaetota bacterium]